MSKDLNPICVSILVPAVTWTIKSLALLSPYDLARRFVWKHYERMPFWFAESYVLGWFLLVTFAFGLAPAQVALR
jgi:hypothetical protein